MTSRVFIAAIFLLSLSACSQAIRSSTAQETFDRGVSEVTNGNLELGYQTFLSLHNNGYRSGYLYSNLALTAYKMDSLGAAKFYYLMSRDYAETFDASNEALNFIDTRLAQKSPNLPALPWETFFDYLNRILGVQILFILAVLGGNLFVLLQLLFKKRIQGSWWNFFHKMIAFISLLALMSSFYLDYRKHRFADAVVIYGQHSLKEVPKSNGRDIAQTYEGFQCKVDRFASKPDQGWWYVRMSSGMYGWIPAGSIRIKSN